MQADAISFERGIVIQKLSILLLTAVAECSPQFGLLGGLGGGWKVVSTKFVKQVYRDDAKREIVRYGPLELVGKNVTKRSHLHSKAMLTIRRRPNRLWAQLWQWIQKVKRALSQLARESARDVLSCLLGSFLQTRME
jgi:hypothetical protein